MNSNNNQFDTAAVVIGRALLGIYFVVPGIMKITGYSSTLELMLTKEVPLAQLLLPLTILIQVGLGLMLIFGKNVRFSAFVLFVLTILINIFIHNFWALQGDPSYAHELQNFVKNLAIAAGLLALAGSARAHRLPRH